MPLAHLVLALAFVAQLPAQPQQLPNVPSPELLAKLPEEWREPARSFARIPDNQQKQLLGSSDEIVRQAVARLLVRNPKADEFVKVQVRSDPSPRVRTTIVQGMGTARWLEMPGTAALLEEVAKADPDPAVSLLALDTVRRWRMRGLGDVLAARLAAAKAAGDAKTAALLMDEQERWISLERGTMLPAFLRVPPPVFSVKAADKPVRVLAFGDFGNGSEAQKTLAQTMLSYHRGQPVDLAITTGDNFYSRGMESTSDPRWKPWFEDLYGPLGITFYASLGNHDWGHPDSPAAEVLYSSPTWRMPASYYTFTAGPVQFFALDTQSVALSDKQLQWLDTELARSTARWKVVYGHHPIYSGGNYEDRPDLIARLLPILRDRAHAYICGHDHNLQALKSEGGVRFFVAGAGGAGLYQLRQYERTIFASSVNGFAVLDANATRLKVSFVDVTGKTVYEETLGDATTAPAVPR
jgi:tartrate-resistant acid phosphatase type 5